MGVCTQSQEVFSDSDALILMVHTCCDMLVIYVMNQSCTERGVVVVCDLLRFSSNACASKMFLALFISNKNCRRESANCCSGIVIVCSHDLLFLMALPGRILL